MRSPLHLKKLLSQYMVNVTNSGNMDAVDVVLGFLAPPGAGENGVPLQVLFGAASASAERSVVKLPALVLLISKCTPVLQVSNVCSSR
eukprot:SAG31_NODE_30230_length_384_cov_0.491228_1_plen_87_part_10